MSRLGNLIQTERLRKNMSLKELAKKTGVSEKYLQEVENGKRIIQDDQARRILKTMGLEQTQDAAFLMEDVAAAVDLKTIMPPKKTLKKTPAQEPVSGSIWLDALSSVLKRVPVYNYKMEEMNYRLLPVLDNKIEGFSPEKIFYLQVSGHQMEGYRLYEGDLLLTTPTQSPVDNGIMLAEYEKKRILCKIKLLDTRTLLLITNEKEPQFIKAFIQDVHFIGHCIRLESALL